MGWMIKSAVPLREESVAMFKSLCAASEGLTQNPLRVWEWLKTLKNRRFLLVPQTVIDIVCYVSQVQRLAESRPWLCTKR